MNKEKIELLVKTGILRKRQVNIEEIKSMLASSEINARVTKGVALNEDSATLIFREIYESVRQLGDAKWWLEGYEPSNHEISIDILKETPIANSLKLNHLERFKKIRHDANYRGFRVSIEQAIEILLFWDDCGSDIIKLIREQIKR